MHHPVPVGIVPLATVAWKRNKSHKHNFYGHSYTCPTPLEYAQQQFGLAHSTAVALHIRDAKQGKLVEPSDPNDDDFGPDDPSDILDLPSLDGSSISEPSSYSPPNFFQPSFPSPSFSVADHIATSATPPQTFTHNYPQCLWLQTLHSGDINSMEQMFIRWALRVLLSYAGS